jgi:hypothetical protein
VSNTRKPFIQYRVVVKLGPDTVWEASGFPTSNRYAAEYAATTLNKFMREGGTQQNAVVREETRGQPLIDVLRNES